MPAFISCTFLYTHCIQSKWKPVDLLWILPSKRQPWRRDVQRDVKTLHEMAALLFDGRTVSGTAARYNTDDPMAQTVQRQYKEHAELLVCHPAQSFCQKTCQNSIKSSVACGIYARKCVSYLQAGFLLCQLSSFRLPVHTNVHCPLWPSFGRPA